MQWKTSSYSVDKYCVEVAHTPDGVSVRHSKDADGAVLHYTPEEWDAFLAGVRDGEFDRP